MILCIQLYIKTPLCQAEPAAPFGSKKRFGMLYKFFPGAGVYFVRMLRSFFLDGQYKSPSAGLAEGRLGLFSKQGLDLLPVDPDEEEQCGGKADHFRNGEGPPYGVHIPGQAQQICRRQQGDELPEQ